MNGQDLLTRKEVAAMFRISLPTVYKYAKTGVFPAHRVGTRTRFKKEEIEQCLLKVIPEVQNSHDGQ